MHRNPFKPHRDHPSLNEMIERTHNHVRATAPPECPNCCDESDCASVDICNAIHDVYANDLASSIHHACVRTRSTLEVGNGK